MVIELGDAYTGGNDAQDLHADLREGRYIVQRHRAYASGAAGRSSARSSASGGSSTEFTSAKGEKRTPSRHRATRAEVGHTRGRTGTIREAVGSGATSHTLLAKDIDAAASVATVKR